MTQSNQPVLVAGKWRAAIQPTGSFQAANPTTGQMLPISYPISGRTEVIEAVEAAHQAAQILRTTAPEKIAAFLERFADLIEGQRESLIDSAYQESGLPREPRLKGETGRTTNQLRQAAQAAREGSWTNPVIDSKLNIRSILAPLGGAVVVFGPNNFPFAFNSISGGDFAAAIASRNPVIAKANPAHPGTTFLLAQLAFQAVQETGLPEATIQLIYHFENSIGLELVSHPLIGATGFTGSRAAGLKLKEAADRVGKPIYLEMSSVNPVFMLRGVLEERLEALAGEYFTSCTLESGQFCTNPGLVILPASPQAEAFIQATKERFTNAQPGVLLGEKVVTGLVEALKTLTEAGAEVITGSHPIDGEGYRFANTLLRVDGERFLRHAKELQAEAFGPVGLFILARDEQQILEIAKQLEGNLTGTIYSHTSGKDDAFYQRLEPLLRQRVGRLLNDKMPTGVAVSPAMQHGGPFPSTGHPGFTSVGIPASIRRFTALHSYDNVRPARLPLELQNPNPTGRLWRLIDGELSQADVPDNN